MWLFGMITIIEMLMARTIETQYPEGIWQQELSEGRLKKAMEIFEERKRRNQVAKLIDCLQLSDKAYILMKDPVLREDAGFESKRAAKTAMKGLDSLRNNLAHAQDLLTYNWAAILEMSNSLEKVMTRI